MPYSLRIFIGIMDKKCWVSDRVFFEKQLKGCGIMIIIIILIA
jgi:hypothetical protein